MIVCSCHAVRDRDIDRHLDQGCRTVSELGRRCGAGTDCGSCVVDLRERLARRRLRTPLQAVAGRLAAK